MYNCTCTCIKNDYFRQLANLGKKTDDRLTLYFHDFKEMCRRVIKRKRPKMGRLSNYNVDNSSIVTVSISYYTLCTCTCMYYILCTCTCTCM